MTVTLSKTGVIKVQFAQANTVLFAERSDIVNREAGVAVQAIAVRAPVGRIKQKGIEVVGRGGAAAAADAFQWSAVQWA